MSKIYKHNLLKKRNKNPYFYCPDCGRDDISLIPPSLGEPSFFVCADCNKQVVALMKIKDGEG